MNFDKYYCAITECMDGYILDDIKKDNEEIFKKYKDNGFFIKSYILLNDNDEFPTIRVPGYTVGHIEGKFSSEEFVVDKIIIYDRKKRLSSFKEEMSLELLTNKFKNARIVFRRES
jgi:hypothetical protein